MWGNFVKRLPGGVPWSSGDIYYSSVLEEMKLDGPDFKADSWSMAVDGSYLQGHSKTVIKRQDVIYGTTAFAPGIHSF